MSRNGNWQRCNLGLDGIDVNERRCTTLVVVVVIVCSAAIVDDGDDRVKCCSS